MAVLAALHPYDRLRALEVVPKDCDAGRFAGVITESSTKDIDAAGAGDALCEVHSVEISECRDIFDSRPFPL